MKIPDQCSAYFNSAFGEQVADKLMKHFAVPQVRQAIRRNHLIDGVLDEGLELEQIDWLNDGFFVTKSEDSIGNTDSYKSGLIYPQEASSQLAVKLLDPKRGEMILDLCASPGSKTTQIASLIRNDGLLVANEVDSRRAQTLKHNLWHFGVMCQAVTTLDSTYFAKNLPNFFDRILVDAPCSGEGMFFKFPNVISHWNEKTIRFNAKRQCRILKSAFASLKVGGRLVYSTCTLNKLENEGVVEWLLEQCPNAQVVPVKSFKLPKDLVTGNYVRCMPYMYKTGGFFAACLTKTALTEVSSTSPKIHKISDNKRQWKPASATNINAVHAQAGIIFDPKDYLAMDYKGVIHIQPRLYYEKTKDLPVLAVGMPLETVTRFKK